MHLVPHFQTPYIVALMWKCCSITFNFIYVVKQLGLTLLVRNIYVYKYIICYILVSILTIESYLFFESLDHCCLRSTRISDELRLNLRRLDVH